jgi:bacterioferritin (cytochrome b1)
MTKKVADMLRDALNDEYQAELQYDIHAAMFVGFDRDQIGEHLEEHAGDERGHAKQIVVHLYAKGETVNPEVPAPKTASTMEEMIDQDLQGEIETIERYAEILEALGDEKEYMDTIMLVEGILADEVEHQDELAAFLAKSAKEALSVAGRRVVAQRLAESAKHMDSLGWAGRADHLTETALEIL